MTTGGHIQLQQLTKEFADVVALDHIDLEVHAGEFYSLLGPSGCGKTTTLRLLAGFEQASSGTIHLDGKPVGHLPPNKRNVNTVFQSYALFPFLSVADNIGFGLRYASVGKAEIRRKVGEMLELVRLGGLEKRRPHQLSGGQQQRVALARALVLRPSVLLLDEPLGALDAKLRRALQVELKAIQEQVGITFLFVTHDQEEALTMSDRLAVMSGGRIVQSGTPRQVYEEPADAYVADFLGVSNLLDVEVRRTGGAGRPCRVQVGDFELEAAAGALGTAGPAKVAIRPECVTLCAYADGGDNRIPGMVERVVYQGPTTRVHVRLAVGTLLQALVSNGRGGPADPAAWSQGTAVSVRLEPGALRVLPVEPVAAVSPADEQPTVVLSDAAPAAG